MIGALARFEPGSVLCTSLGRGQLAAAAARSWPTASVRCLFLDTYLAQQAEQANHPLPGNLRFDCQSDFPAGDVDLVALPTTKAGDSELTRDWMQAGHDRLKIGGTLVVATDNRADRWLKEQVERLLPQVFMDRADAGVVYWGTKREPLKKRKEFSCQFAFRDQGCLIRAVSRPGVFAHRRVDGGARALMETMEIPAGARVLELGCGSGVVSLAAAFRAPGVVVTAVDSNPRAIDCTRLGAQLNCLECLTAKLSADPQLDPPGQFDIVLANPPYYSHFRIGQIFLEGAVRALRVGGALYLVTKQPTWYAERMSGLFAEVSVAELRGYTVLCAT